MILRRGCSGIAESLVAAAVAAFAFEPVPIAAADPNPDWKAVQQVCGRCHTTAIFVDKPRSWNRWNDVFADMTQRGANGSDEQLAGVTRYFLENLTFVNVNSSPADEIAGVLSVNDEVAQAIIARRDREPFANLAQLRAVAGVDPEILDQRKSRILFDK